MTRARDVANLIGSGNYSSTTFTATAGQTAFTISHTQGFIQVFMNGLLLDETVDYTSNGSAVTLTSGAAAGDEIEVVAYNTFSVGDALPKSGGAMTGALTVDAAAATVLTVDRATSDGTIIDVQKDGTTVGIIGVAAGDNLYIGSSATNHGGIYMNDTGVLPMSAGSLTDNTRDLGGASNRWNDLFLGGGVHLGGTGSANKLDYYEEGTWTPALARWSGGNISATYVVQTGRYTRIGRMVTASFQLTTSAIASQGSSLLYISGLPYNNNANHNYMYAGTFGLRTAISSSTVATSMIKHSTNNSLLIRQDNDFDENVDDNWIVGDIRGSITYEYG